MKVADPLPIDERLVVPDRNDRCVAAHAIADGGDDPRSLWRDRQIIVECNGGAGDRDAGRIIEHAAADAHVSGGCGCGG